MNYMIERVFLLYIYFFPFCMQLWSVLHVLKTHSFCDCCCRNNQYPGDQIMAEKEYLLNAGSGLADLTVR